jgi:hypothetical protein
MKKKSYLCTRSFAAEIAGQARNDRRGLGLRVKPAMTKAGKEICANLRLNLRHSVSEQVLRAKKKPTIINIQYYEKENTVFCQKNALHFCKHRFFLYNHSMQI